MKIKIAESHDLKYILKLYKFLFPEEDYSQEQNFRKNWELVQKNKYFFVYFLAMDNDREAATCTLNIIPNLTRNQRPYGLIENVVTHPKKRRKGFGKAVMEAAINYAKSMNCYKILLLSSAKRKEAHNFYEFLGFDSKNKKGFQMRLE